MTRQEALRHRIREISNEMDEICGEKWVPADPKTRSKWMLLHYEKTILQHELKALKVTWWQKALAWLMG